MLNVEVTTSSRPNISMYIYIIFGVLIFLFAFLLGWFIKKKQTPSPLDEDSPLRIQIEKLENENTNLTYKLESTSTLKESFFQESKDEIQKYEDKNNVLTRNVDEFAIVFITTP